MAEPTGTTHHFQAAVTQVLRLVINSLYSNKEIFLRELISNASDALDKLRFRAITEPGLLEGETPRVRIAADPEACTLTISDDGVGMTREELERNLGTVAHSGSGEFLQKLEEAAREDVQLIGQFGVGFYSAYLVADRVSVVSRAAGSDAAFRWSSTGEDTFTIEEAQRTGRGTDVILHLKDDQKAYLEPWTLRRLVKRYSDYIDHPIELAVEAESAGAENETGEGEASWEQINSASALWQRPHDEVTQEQYREFYRHLTHDPEPPLAWRHFRIEGTQMFTGLLFIPAKPPFDLFSPETHHGVRLHVKRVFIMDDCDEILPRWLRFVRGVVDSEDLPLNVSRELLQDSRVARTIRKQVTKHALDMVEELVGGDGATSFWSHYGAVIKEGLHFDPTHRERLSKLVRWPSTTQEGLVTLPDYVSRMAEDQKAVYYACGATRQTVQNAPHLEVLKNRGYEVLLMTDPIDQFAVDSLHEVEGKPFVSAMDADLKLASAAGDDEGQSGRKALGPLLSRMRAVLQEQVSKVCESARLTDSPVCLVLPEGGLPPYLERMMRLSNADLPVHKRVLEVNPAHPLVESLRLLHETDEGSAELEGWIRLLYDEALLAEGSPVEDPGRLVGRITHLLTEVAARRVETGAHAS